MKQAFLNVVTDLKLMVLIVVLSQLIALARAISELGPVRLGDVDAAQKSIAVRLAPLRFRGRRPSNTREAA